MSINDYFTPWAESNEYKKHKRVLNNVEDLQKELAELNALEQRYQTLLASYDTSNDTLINAADDYADDVMTNEFKNTNVYVEKLDFNPTANYMGCYFDTPPVSIINVVPILNTSNVLTNNSQLNSLNYVCSASSVYGNRVADATYGSCAAFDQNDETWWHSGTSNNQLYNSSTGVYQGTNSLQYTSGSTNQTVTGEYLWVKMPATGTQKITSYSIYPRKDFYDTRSPNSWMILGGLALPSSAPAGGNNRTNIVNYNGKTYSTLSDIVIDSRSVTCQSTYLALPEGWIIAPDNADSIAVIAAHPWSTHVVCTEKGWYNSANYSTPGRLWSNSLSLLRDGAGRYKPGSSCSFQVLIQKSGGNVSSADVGAMTWKLLDTRSNESFTSQYPQSYNITTPGDYTYYLIVVTKVGNNTGPYKRDNNKNSVQLSINYYYSTESSVSSAESAMSSSGEATMTIDECKNEANKYGYQYFGIQTADANNKAKCLFSNDVFKSKAYGDASQFKQSVLLWSSNTSGKSGVSMQLTRNGNMILTDSGGNTIFDTGNVPGCVQQYSLTANTDSPGNDITYLSNVSVDDCKNACTNNNSCKLVAMNKSTNRNCWLKSSIQQPRLESYYTGRWWWRKKRYRWVGGTNPDSNRDLYIKSNDTSSCRFTLSLQTDGNLVIYRNGQGAVWSSRTYGKNQSQNSEWESKNGKFGRSTIQVGQGLQSGEWIGSQDGSVKLIMQTDGNLVLYTTKLINKCNTIGSTIYGGPSVNAMYNVSENGEPQFVNRLGYVDENLTLTEYPRNMMTVKKNPGQYEVAYNSDSPGYDISSSTVTSVDDCKTLCDNNSNCYGFTYRHSDKKCFLKNKDMYPVGKRGFLDGTDTYYSELQPINNSSCPKIINNIDSVKWNQFEKNANKMSSNTKCGLVKATTTQQTSKAAEQRQLNEITEQIIEKMRRLETVNVDMLQQMGIDKSILEANLLRYTTLMNSDYNMDNIHGILNDSDIMVLQENYSYLMWTIIVTGIVIIAIHQMKS